MSNTVLPPNSTALERALDENNAIRFDGLMSATNESSHAWSAWDCPSAFLPFLAWALSVDSWDTNWPDKVKRQVIASSIFIHRHKGTRSAIDAALSALDLGVTISEWFEHGGEPYTFRVEAIVTSRGVNADDLKSIYAAIANTKNARSFLERLRLHLVPPVDVKAGVLCTLGITLTVPPNDSVNEAQS